MRMLRMLLASALVAGAVAAPALAGGGQKPPKVETSKNVKLLDKIAFDGGTELAADGKYVYAGELDGAAERPSRGTKPDEGGLHIIDVSGKTPKEVGFLHCPGNDNDVEVIKPGFVAVGHHTSRCNPGGHGFFIADVRNPKSPKVVGRISGLNYSHTIKPYPGKPYVYVSPGGLGNGGAITNIVDVSDVNDPKVAATFKPNPTGCHDFSFHITKDQKLGFCSGYGETQIWDVSDPVAPVTIGRIHNPFIQFQHYAVASSDGKLLAIDDEAFAAHDCNTGQSPTGRVWIYDISNPQVPVPQGSFAAPRGGGSAPGIGTYVGWAPSWCLSHGLDWQPGTHNLAVTWFTGGWSVLDVSDPTRPTEVAWGQSEAASTYSVLWHNGNLYTNDFSHGFDGFKVSGLPKK